VAGIRRWNLDIPGIVSVESKVIVEISTAAVALKSRDTEIGFRTIGDPY
jgi:hypothetical protein